MTVDGTDQRRRVPESGRARARDAALRRSRAMIAGIAAGAVALSGLFSVVAAQAFKGHQQDGTTAPRAGGAAATATRSDTEDPAPLRAPAQPPAASDPQPSAPAPEPQVSGGS
jgi:hypothetical protein